MATVTLVERNGMGSGVDTSDPSNINFGNVDASELDPQTYPIPVSASATSDVRSYEKFLRIEVELATITVQVDNFRVWKDSGDYREGEVIKTNLTSVFSRYSQTAYEPPSLTTRSAIRDIPITQPASSNLGIGGSLLGAIIPTSTDNFTDWCVLQQSIFGSSDFQFGDLEEKVIVFQYDEQ